MAWITSLFGRSKDPVAVDEKDEVYPTSFHDCTQEFQSLVIASVWQFNDVLDPDKLHASLCHHLEIGDWRKLGGRFRRVEDKLEIHVPTPFTSQRPAVAYSHEVFGMRLQDHPLAGKIPKPTDQPSFHPPSEELSPLVIRADNPQTVEDFVTSEEPMLSLHIVSFDDATLLSLTWPHALMDANGLGSLVSAWSLVLAGRKEDVPALSSVRHDLLWEAAGSEAAQQEKSTIADLQLSGFRLVSFALSMLWDMMWNGMESRVVHLPMEFVQSLRTEALREITENATEGTEGPWISEFDTILAAWLRSLALSQPKPNSVALALPYDSQRRLPGIFKKDETHVGNFVLNEYTNFSAEETRQSVGSIAWKLRQELLSQTTQAQVLATLRIKRERWEMADKSTALHMRPADTLFLATNWASAKHFHVANFGPAVVRQGEGDERRSNAPGTPILYHPFTVKTAWTNRNFLITTGKDQSGGVWLHGTFTAQTWNQIQKSFGME